MPDIVVETERLMLRTIQEGDVAEHHRLLNTPAVMARRPDLDFDDPAYPAEDNPTIVYALTRE